jgi:predicted nucleic acid-binding protein
MPDLVADSSFIYALFNKDEKQYQNARRFATEHPGVLLIPDVVLPEVTYLFRKEGGVRAVTAFLVAFDISGMKLECLAIDLLRRSREIMALYPDARLDFVDCCIMALSERLNLTQVCTFDRRDFSIFRPAHCEYLELLP